MHTVIYGLIILSFTDQLDKLTTTHVQICAIYIHMSIALLALKGKYLGSFPGPRLAFACSAVVSGPYCNCKRRKAEMQPMGVVQKIIIPMGVYFTYKQN